MERELGTGRARRACPRHRLWAASTLLLAAVCAAAPHAPPPPVNARSGPPPSGLHAGRAQDEPAPTDEAAGEAAPGAPTPEEAPETAPPSAAAAGTPLETSAANPLGFLAADSEVVYGPTLFGVEPAALAAGLGGRVSQVAESVDGAGMTGPDIVTLVAQRYSVGPRVLLALAETLGGWVRGPGSAVGDATSLYAVLSTIADELNGAYYGYKLDGRRTIALSDGRTVTVDAVNPGTFAVLAVLGARTTSAAWAGLELPSRYYAVWTNLYGEEPAYYASAAPAAPDPGPLLLLPFGPAEIWYYVLGPHAPAGAGAPWAAVDFAPPPATETGCVPSPYAVTAIAGGTVAVSSAAGILVDFDEDGSITTGWVDMYEHLSPLGRIAAGGYVAKGGRLGFPACDGGATPPARVSVSRRYFGEWVPTSSTTAPMILDGWLPRPGTEPGKGTLVTTGLPPRVPSIRKVDAVNGVARR